MADIKEQRIERILQICQELTSMAPRERLLHKIVAAAAELTNSEAAGILLLDKRKKELRFVAASLFSDQLVDISVPIDRSVAGAAFSSGNPIIVPDVQADPRYYPVVEQLTGFEARSLLAVPLQFKERRIGVLEAKNKRNNELFDQEDVETLTLLAAQAVVAIENARLVETLQKTHDELARRLGERERLLEIERNQRNLAEALRRASAAFTGTLDYNEVLDRILEQIRQVVPQAAANIMLIEGPDNTARVFRGHGYEQFGSQLTVSSISFSVDDVPNLRTMQQTGQPMVVPDVERDESWVRSQPEHTWIKSYAGAPIRIRNRVIGFLNVNSPIPNFFSRVDAERLQTFADHAAIAIENARLYEQAQREISERKRAERDLQEHRDRLEELVMERTAELQARNDELDAFAHTVAHDLKEPLTAILGFAQMTEEHSTSLPEEQLREYLHVIAQRGRKLSNIIEELLVLSSVRREDVQSRPLDMARIVAEARQRLGYMIEEYQAEVIVPEAWPAALGHASWVEEVWVNYLSNAIQHGGQPPRVELGAEEQPDGMVRFWVRDNGLGIASENQARLFIPFTQLGQVRTKGHGLGLSIVLRIVKKLGGQVGVASQVGHGSVFSFTLPGTASS